MADFTFEKKTVRTRFAPSPTGFLHIGGVRTAIFNWAFARRFGGKFYLRIDDTDVDRHVDGAVEKIIKDLAWIGLDYDICEEDIEQGRGGSMRKPTISTYLMRHNGDMAMTEPGVVYQSLRGHAYIAAVHTMSKKDMTYPCFCTEAETEAIRDQCRKEGKRFVCPCRDLPHNERPWHKTFCTRLDVTKASQGQDELTVNDLILGPVKKSVKDISDSVLCRSGGGITYNLACTVDDIDMRITHVVRGQEHLSNTFLQLLIYQALDAKPPEFAHIPFICAPKSTKKLSKRDAASLGVAVHLEEYREIGYLPQALFNYLSHLGWAMDASTEKWTVEQFVAAFGFQGCVKTQASFDPDKLFWLQSEYMKELSVGQKTALLQDWHESHYGHRATVHILPQVVKAAGDRLKVLSDIKDYRHFWDNSQFILRKEAVEKRLTHDVVKILRDFAKTSLASLSSWHHDSLEACARSYCEEHSIKTASLIHALRVATTGTMVGLGVFEGMAILGKEPTLHRIEMTVEYASFDVSK